MGGDAFQKDGKLLHHLGDLFLIEHLSVINPTKFRFAFWNDHRQRRNRLLMAEKGHMPQRFNLLYHHWPHLFRAPFWYRTQGRIASGDIMGITFMRSNQRQLLLHALQQVTKRLCPAQIDPQRHMRG